MRSSRVWQWVLLIVAGCWLAACGGTAPGESLEMPAPGEVRAVALSKSAIRVTWTPPDGAELVTYRLQRRRDLQGEFSDLGAPIPAAAASEDGLVFVDVDLEPETFYGYRVIGVDRLGQATPASTVAGARTAPAPAIDVELQLQSNRTDDDGLVLRVEGPDTVERAVGAPTSRSLPVSIRVGPLRRGDYRVLARGLATNCRLTPATPTVTVTDEGTATVVRQILALVCRDPSRGDVVAEVTVRGGSNAAALGVELSTTAAGVPDAERLVRQAIPAQGGRAEFLELRPVLFDARLTGVTAPCRAVGAGQVGVTPRPLGSDTVRFIVDCDVPAPPPSTPYVFRYGITSGTFAPGARVALPVRVDLSGGPATTLSGVQAQLEFDAAVLRVDSTVSRPGWSCLGNITRPGRLTFVATSGAVPPPPPDLCTFWVTVIGSAGSTTQTRTTALAMSNVDGDVIPNELFSGAEVRFTVGTGSGGGGGGGNQAPTAVIGGTAPLSVTAGQALAVSGTGSSDPDGSIASYAWSFPGGTPTSATGANASVTYAAAGSYTITLTVTDNAGATATATRVVQVSAAGGGGTTNIAPTAVIAGGPSLSATVGAPLSVSAAGSTDPDGTITAYAWAFPGGTPASATGASALVTYATAGTYTLSLTVTDDRGAVGTTSRTVTVTAAGGGPGGPFLWSGSFGALSSPDSIVTLTVTYDLSAEPTAALESFRIDSLTWDPTQLSLRSINWGFGIGQTFTNQSFVAQGRLVNSGGTFGAAGRGGLLTIVTIRFRLLPGATRGSVTATRTFLGAVLATQAAGGASYLPRTTITDGTFSVP